VRFIVLELDLTCDCEFVGLHFKSGIFEVRPDFELVRFIVLELDLTCDCEFVGLHFKSGILRLGQILNL
jgi:hypothetical protein